MTQCRGCHKEILGAYIEALGCSWHQEHFVCAACGKPFDQANFLEHEGQPYCENDYAERFAKRCHSCNKPISGEYVEALGYTWHRHHFVCAQCGRTFENSKFVDKDGAPYCQHDYLELFAKRCHHCGKPIEGEYVQALGNAWHREHLTCTICGKPCAGGFVEHEGKPYCADDFNECFGIKCRVCGHGIVGKYLTNEWGESYCERHKEEFGSCFSCDRLICSNLTQGGVKYADGRQICNICRQTAIDEQSDLAPVFEVVHRTLAAQGLPVDGFTQIPVRLAALDELDRLAGGTPAIEAGMTLTQVKILGSEEISRTVKEVLVLYGLPRTHTLSILAHEYGHVWAFLHHVPEMTKKTAEGICQLLAHFCLSQLDSPDAQYHILNIEQNTDSEYGDGFREARDALGGSSIGKLFERVRKTGKLSE